MEIAKGITSKKYKALDLTTYDSSDWMTAADFLQKRINDRFFEPIDFLINSENNLKSKDKKFGFTVLAIDCLILETLECFYEGITNSSGKSESLFISFLTGRENFKIHFSEVNHAKIFYKSIRCGILHQSQSFNKTRIRTIGKMVEFKSDILIINRNEFHFALKREFEFYINLIKEKHSNSLLENFKLKMDFLAS